MKIVITFIFLSFTLTNHLQAKDLFRIFKPIYLKCSVSNKEIYNGYLLKIGYDEIKLRYFINPKSTKDLPTEKEIYKITGETDNNIYGKKLYFGELNEDYPIEIDRSEEKLILKGYIKYACKKIDQNRFNTLLSLEEKRSKGEVKSNKF